MPGPQAVGQRNLRKALVAAKGNMAAAARLLGIDRSAVWRKVQASPALQEFLADIVEESGDDLEQKLHDLGMGQNNVTAILAILNARHRDRGYGFARTDVVVSGEVAHTHLHLHAEKFRHLSTDRLADLLEQRLAEDEPKLIDVTPEQRRDILPSKRHTRRNP